MNKAETARLLTIASMIDNRTVAPETVEAWHEVIGDLDFNMAREAVAMHRRESGDYLMPVHIVGNYKRVTALRKSQVRNAVTAQLVPKDWPIERALPLDVILKAEQWFAAREMPVTDRDWEAYNAYMESLTDEEHKAQRESGGRSPWRTSPQALAVLS